MIEDVNLWDYYQKEGIARLNQNNPRQEYIFRLIKKYIKKGDKVLEIGFGNGALLNLMSFVFKTYAADISQENIERLKSGLSKVNFNQIDVDGKLPYSDNFFSGFVASEVLEHMDDKELELCIKEIERILRPGGIAVITVPAEENFKLSECFCPKCGHVFHKFGHKQVWNKNIIKNKFTSFEIIKIGEYFDRFTGKTKIDKILGKVMWFVQTTLNYIIKFPNKIYRNRSYVIILKK